MNHFHSSLATAGPGKKTIFQITHHRHIPLNTRFDYQWQSYLTRNSDSERITIDSGYIEVRPNRDLATTDPRSHYKIVLDAVEAVLEKRATKDQEAYSINGRSLTRTSIEELMKLRDTYRGKYVAEINRHRAKKGLGHHGRLLTRFL